MARLGRSRPIQARSLKTRVASSAPPPAAEISYVGAGTPVVQATTIDDINSNLPTHEVGDLLLFSWWQWDEDDVLVAPSGYTLAGSFVDGTATRSHIYWKIAGASEVAPTAQTVLPTRYVSYVVAYRGVDATSPFIAQDGTNESGGSGTTTHSAPTLNNTDPAAWGVFGMDVKIATPGSTSPGSGLTERLDTDLTSGVGNIVAHWADTDGVIATGDHTFSGDSSAGTANGTMWAAILRPAAEEPPIEESTSNFFAFI